MALTAKQIEERRAFVGCSDLPAIMRGEWFDLWSIKTGRRKPDDLSRVWAVQLGVVTEPLNLDFYEWKTGKVVQRRGEEVICPTLPMLRCTLDGYVDGLGPIQAKCTNGFSKLPDIREKYYPQVTGEMLCTEDRSSILSVIVGGSEPVHERVDLDDFYALDLRDRVTEFWSYVVADKEPPGAPPAAAPPVPIDAMRTVDMTGSNTWASFAQDWIETGPAAKRFEAAAKGLKGLVEADVRLATGAGVTVSRDRRGLAIKRSDQ